MFRIEGRLRHMNYGEFYIYSPDGGIDGIDTIKVQEGRFTYDTGLRDPATFVIIFPNFSELAVFGEPGKTVEIKGDASHMKEMTVKGTEANEDMTELRMELNRLVPPQIPAEVEKFIKNHRQSPASIYLLKRYFVADPEANLRKAAVLTKMLLEQMPDDGQLIQLDRRLRSLKSANQKTLPSFSATDLRDRKISEKDLKAEMNMVTVWASWNYKSTEFQRRLKSKKDKYGDRLGVVSICLDADPKSVKKIVVERDSLKWPTICDGRIWETPLLSKFGFCDVPSNILIDSKGNIRERNLDVKKMEDLLDNLLKK